LRKVTNHAFLAQKHAGKRAFNQQIREVKTKVFHVEQDIGGGGALQVQGSNAGKCGDAAEARRRITSYQVRGFTVPH
jgi:hypothetical protein